jgi:hypothetical protein
MSVDVLEVWLPLEFDFLVSWTISTKEETILWMDFDVTSSVDCNISKLIRNGTLSREFSTLESSGGTRTMEW